MTCAKTVMTRLENFWNVDLEKHRQSDILLLCFVVVSITVFYIS